MLKFFSCFLLIGMVFNSEARAFGVHGGVNLGTMPAGTSSALGFVVGVQKTFSFGGLVVEANLEYVKRSYTYFDTTFGAVNYTPSYYVLELPLLLKIGEGKSLPALLIGPDPQFNISTYCTADVPGNGCFLRTPNPFSLSVQGGLSREIKFIGMKSYIQARYTYQIIGTSSSNSSLKLNGFMFLVGADF